MSLLHLSVQIVEQLVEDERNLLAALTQYLCNTYLRLL